MRGYCFSFVILISRVFLSKNVTKKYRINFSRTTPQAVWNLLDSLVYCKLNVALATQHHAFAICFIVAINATESFQGETTERHYVFAEKKEITCTRHFNVVICKGLKNLKISY